MEKQKIAFGSGYCICPSCGHRMVAGEDASEADGIQYEVKNESKYPNS